MRRRSSPDGPVHVAFLAPSFDTGGAERQMLLLAGALPRDRFEVSFLAMSSAGSLAPEAESLGIPVHVLGLGRDAFRSRSPRIVGDMAGAIRAYRHLTRDVDIVDAWLVPAYTFAGTVQPIVRVPVLLAGRRSSLAVARTRTWYREVAGRFAMHGVRAVVANSQSAADEAVAIERIDRAKVHVIRNAVTPIPLSATDRRAIRADWGLEDDLLLVGCVGNFKPGKGHQLLLEVASDLRDRYPRLRYRFIGEGPLQASLEAEIARLGLGDLVMLHTGERDARRLYGAFDIAVQASDSEGLPNAVLEAAAAGRAIVATDVGGTREIITTERDGLLVPQGDRAGMAAAIARLVEDDELRGTLGEAAAQRALEMSPARLAEQTAELYLRLLAS